MVPLGLYRVMVPLGLCRDSGYGILGIIQIHGIPQRFKFNYSTSRYSCMSLQE